ncbi:MAG TPA: ABC transporter permease, partial [Actinomycetaceae bacterium]|nr:ABC transporter permease [Actinomycetaceae bacterium]
MRGKPATRAGVSARSALRIIGRALVVLVLTYTLVFAVLYALPSDPAAIMLSQSEEQAGDLEARERFREELGLNRPVMVQYLDGMWGMVRGDFGVSLSQRRPVLEVVGGALPATFAVAGLGLLFSVVGAVLLAALAMTTRFRWLGSALKAIPSFQASLPVFWVGLVLIQLFAFTFPLFPPTGNRGFSSLILPAITLGLSASASLAQVFISALETTYKEPYIVTARAAAARPWTVFLRHAFRNASIPAITMLGVIVGNLLSGTVVVETVFARSGLGRVVQNAVL